MTVQYMPYSLDLALTVLYVTSLFDFHAVTEHASPPILMEGCESTVPKLAPCTVMQKPPAGIPAALDCWNTCQVKDDTEPLRPVGIPLQWCLAHKNHPPPRTLQ